MWRTCIIAAAIILGAVIIGDSIQRSVVPESVKVQQKLDADAKLSEKEASKLAKRLARENKEQEFFNDILGRIPNEEFVSLRLGEKVIYGLTKIFSKHYVLPSILASLALMCVLYGYRREKGSMTTLLCVQALPRVSVVVIGTVLLSYSISFTLSLFSIGIIAMFYQVFSVILKVALALIVTSLITSSGFALFDKAYKATESKCFSAMSD